MLKVNEQEIGEDKRCSSKVDRPHQSRPRSQRGECHISSHICSLLTDNLTEIFKEFTFSNKDMSALLILSMAVDNSRANETALSARFVTDARPFFS